MKQNLPEHIASIRHRMHPQTTGGKLEFLKAIDQVFLANEHDMTRHF